MSAAGVAGPLFISVGRPDQLAKFLEINPELAQAKALIDDSPTFEGYKSAGFNYLMGDKELEEVPDFKPPKTMGMGKWFRTPKLATLSPIPEDKSGMKLGDVPPGVKVPEAPTPSTGTRSSSRTRTLSPAPRRRLRPSWPRWAHRRVARSAAQGA